MNILRINESLLEANNLNLATQDQKTILDHLNFKIMEGEYVILIGSNGSGKSSLMKCIEGLYNPTGGWMLYGKDLSMSKKTKNMCTLTQNADESLFLDLTIFENIVCSSKIKITRNQVEKYLVDFSKYLSKHLDQPVKKLSGGQKQVLALSMCFFQRPKLFLLDEHTSALDPQKAFEIMELIRKYKIKNPDLTILMTTHNLDDAMKYGDRVIVMKHGKIVSDLKKEEKDIITKDYLLKLY